jgi:ATP synthase I chain
VIPSGHLPDLDAARLGGALRRTRIAAGVFGLLALVVGGVVGQPYGGLGVVIGLVAGALNTRSVDGAVARLRAVSGDAKATRRPLALRTAGRLGVVTAVVITLMVMAPPVGLGMLLGLVVYQAAFLASMLGAVLRSGVSS